jgi:hypothetical protein
VKEAFLGEPNIPIMLGSWIGYYPVSTFENLGKFWEGGLVTKSHLS